MLKKKKLQKNKDATQISYLRKIKVLEERL